MVWIMYNFFPRSIPSLKRVKPKFGVTFKRIFHLFQTESLWLFVVATGVGVFTIVGLDGISGCCCCSIFSPGELADAGAAGGLAVPDCSGCSEPGSVAWGSSEACTLGFKEGVEAWMEAEDWSGCSEVASTPELSVDGESPCRLGLAEGRDVWGGLLKVTGMFPRCKPIRFDHQLNFFLLAFYSNPGSV